MDTLECIAGRRSIRKFLDIPVEFEKLGHIIDAARFAPSAGNVQDWKCILITDNSTRQELGKACLEQYWIGEAPMLLVVCTDPERTKRLYGDNGEKYSMQNGAAVVQNMLLAIHAQGLGSCWVGAFEDEMVKRLLGIPQGVIIHAILPIGYPDERVPAPQRLTIENVTFLGGWGNRVKDIAAYMEWYGEHVLKAFNKGKELVKGFARRVQQ